MLESVLHSVQVHIIGPLRPPADASVLNPLSGNRTCDVYRVYPYEAGPLLERLCDAVDACFAADVLDANIRYGERDDASWGGDGLELAYRLSAAEVALGPGVWLQTADYL